MQYHNIDIPSQPLADFCRRHHIRRLSLFGSILRDDFGPESDVDVLVEFLPDTKVSLFDLGGMQLELCKMFGRQVDLKTAGFLSSRFRDGVIRSARVQYAA